MNIRTRILGYLTGLLFLPVSAYCDGEYRWPKAQLLPPEPYAESPIIVVPHASEVPVIDGDLSDSCWDNAVAAHPFMRCYEGLCAPFPTQAKIFYDSECLYFGFTCIKIDPEKHTAREYSEVLLTPPSTNEFFKAAVSELGKLDTSIWGGIPVPSWKGDLRYAAKQKDNGWSSEIVIPFSAMEVSAPKTGDSWKANLGRRAALGFRYNVAWAISYAWFYEPDFFGRFLFEGPNALSAEFIEIANPTPNRNPFQLKLTNRSSKKKECAIEVVIRKDGSDTMIFRKTVEVRARKSSDVSAFYDLFDGGPQVVTITVRDTKENKCILRHSIPNHMPRIRQPYTNALSILRRLSEPGRENFFYREDDRIEFEWLKVESKRIESVLADSTLSRSDWEDLQEPVEAFWARTERLDWWITHNQTLHNRDYAVTVETPLTKLLRDKACLNAPADQVSIEAARGEFEAAQLVVIPRHQDLKNTRLELSSLKGPKGNSIPAENLTWKWIDFVQTRQPHCPIDYIGWYSDPLLPGTSRSIEATQIHQPIWLTVKTPYDIASGTYRGTIRVLADNQKPWEIELRVRVHDFDLPKKPFLQTSLWLHDKKIAAWYGWEIIPKDILLKQYAFLLEYRINPAPIFEPHLELENLPFCIERGLNAVQLGFAAAQEWPIRTPELVNEYYRYLKDNDRLDLGYIYAQDEPAPAEYASVRATLDKVGEAFPGLRRVGTVSPPAPEIEGGLDVWVVGPNLYYYTPVAERVAAGDEMWIYLSASVKRPFVNWYIDYTGVENRLITWQCYKYGATGLLYWGINEWQANEKPWTGDPTIDHAIENGARWPEVPWNTWSYLNSNGEAQLIYPGPEGEFWSSLRLEIIRDAIDDYDYLCLLERSCEALEKSASKQKDKLLEQSRMLLNVGPPLVYDLRKGTNDPQDILNRRHDIALQIERNQRAIK